MSRSEKAGGLVAEAFRDCPQQYNYVSCVNTALLKVWSSARGRQEEDLKLPRFSKHAVEYASGNPPPPGVDMKKYVEAVKAAASEALATVLYFEFVLETPLTIHTRWPYLPLEIGIAWHPVLNVPYIPASSLKGALRAAAAGRICGMEPSEAFGTTSAEGRLIVFDAYPVQWEKPVEPDVITPHYREASGEIDETSASPTPLVYPVVPPGTKFAVLIASGDDLNRCAAELLNYVERALAKGLGAKTAVGYGVFKRA